MDALLGAAGGFLLAVLWMDLMFDVQVLRHPGEDPLPEPVLASIAGYYRRVTTEARPMGHAVGGAMALAIGAAALQLARGGEPRWLAGASLALAGAPAALAMARVLPNAVRLGARSDPPAQQSALARAIWRDHLACLAAILGFLGLRIGAAAL